MVGALAALVVSSRQAPVKLGFNLANYFLLSVVMLMVFRTIEHTVGAPGILDYAAAFAATLAAAVIGAVNIAAAITLSGGAPQFKKLPDMLQFGALVAVANTSIALLAVTILWFSPGAIWLLVIPIVTLFLAYGAWVSEREKHERLELIYQSSRILQHTPGARHRAGRAAGPRAVHVPRRVGRDRPGVRRRGATRRAHHVASQDGPSETILPIRGRCEIDASLQRLIAERRAGFVGAAAHARRPSHAHPPGHGGATGGRIGRHRLVHHRQPPDRGNRRSARMTCACSRRSPTRPAVALENGQLEQSLAELSRLKEQLRYQAFHDPLTGLANRVPVHRDASRRRIARPGAGRRPAGRPLPRPRRLQDRQRQPRPRGRRRAAGRWSPSACAAACATDDLAARLGGDEFAILLEDDDGADARDGRSAERMHRRRCGTPFLVARPRGRRRRQHRHRDEPRARHQRADELLRQRRRGDVHRQGRRARGRFAVFDPTMHAADRGAPRADRRAGARHRPQRARRAATSRSSTCDTGARSSASRPSSAGGIRPAGWSRRTSSSRWPRRPGSILPLGRWVLRRPAARPRARQATCRPDGPLHERQRLGRAAPGSRTSSTRSSRSSRAPASSPASWCSRSPRAAMIRDTQATIAKLDDAARARACGSRSTTSAPATRR